ncbi:AAA domain-containing protein [Paenibacillus sp. HB172176]|uniref:AAA domain-containing protein n=1 Tax=Paenibacillus sp. HB172176 TaxID=2493690 RepID=UPI0014388A3E|nr:AAA domain-containing protein [Paenibacillus sp. HB172176]
MMNEFELLIVTDRGDKTNEVMDYRIDESTGKVHVRYCNKPDKPYPFSAQNIIIRKNPRHEHIENKAVLHNRSLLQNVRHALVFGEFTKVFFDDGESQLFKTAAIAYADMKDNYRTLVDIMGYWREVAPYIKSDDSKESFLEGQYARLRSVESESVLAAYMEKRAIKQYAPPLIPAIYPFQFNLSQKGALEQALAHNLSIIQGPPGTGKTQTILNIIANLAIRLNKTVAVVSSNNAAVQNVRDKLLEKGYGFIAAALGNTEIRSSFFKSLPDYPVVADWKCEHPERIEKEVARIGLKLDRLLELANRRALLDREIEAYRTERRHFELHHRDLDYDRLEKLFYRRQSPDTIISFLADEYFTEDRALRFLQKSKLLFKYGFYQLKKMKQNRLTLISKIQMRFYDVTIEQLEAKREGIQAVLEQESFADLIKAHQSQSTVLFNHHLYERYHKTTKFEGNEKSFKDNFEEFMRCFPVMLSTTHSLRSCIPDSFLFDYVIIDEASQARKD